MCKAPAKTAQSNDALPAGQTAEHAGEWMMKLKTPIGEPVDPPTEYPVSPLRRVNLAQHLRWVRHRQLELARAGRYRESARFANIARELQAALKRQAVATDECG